MEEKPIGYIGLEYEEEGEIIATARLHPGGGYILVTLRAEPSLASGERLAGPPGAPPEAVGRHQE